MNKKEVFKKNVKQYFDFLVNDHGFKEIEISADILSYGAGISYMRNDLFIDITFEDRGSCIEVNFGKLLNDSVKEEEFSYHMFLGIINKALHYQLGASIANTEVDVVELLDIYAKSLKKDGMKILKNKEKVFKKMRKAEKKGKGLCVPYYEQNKIVSKFI